MLEASKTGQADSPVNEAELNEAGDGLVNKADPFRLS